MPRIIHATPTGLGSERGLASRPQSLLLRSWSLAPSLALGVMFSLMVRVKITEGFWPYHPFVGPRSSALPPGFEFDAHHAYTMLAVLVGVAAALTTPIAVFALWQLRGSRTYWVNLACLATSALLLCSLFGNPRGWSDGFFD